MNFVEKYTWFGGDVFEVKKDFSIATLGEVVRRDASWSSTALKIVSMVLSFGITFLAAVVIKEIDRWSSDRLNFAAPFTPSQRNILNPLPPRSEAARILNDQLSEPLNRQLILRAQTIDSRNPFTIDPELVSDNMSQFTHLDARERKYCADCAQVELDLVATIYPQIKRVIDELNPHSNVSPRPRSGVHGLRPEVTQTTHHIPLHLRSGGHVLGP